MHDRSFEKLGAAVRERRRALGLKQVELAELARCSTRFVHMVEAGKTTVRLDKLLALLGILGLGLQVARGPRLAVPDVRPGGTA
ncbi:MAG: helix-turn-helix domain-containing protein [Planctomycetes bacterium]|nr:helix-turn-helix domain-containing protein [Planctomycetota bacterium]